MTIFKSEGLSSAAIEMLGQLYVIGPTWDGNVCSKQGRGELCRAGLAWHEHGYASLTPEGVLTDRLIDLAEELMGDVECLEEVSQS